MLRMLWFSNNRLTGEERVKNLSVALHMAPAHALAGPAFLEVGSHNL